MGDDFLLAAEVAIEAIKRNPEQFLFKHESVWRALMKRFPYVVYFLVEEAKIFILAVIHERRNPEYHQSKTK